MPPTLPLTDASLEPDVTTMSPAFSAELVVEDAFDDDNPTFPVEMETEPLDPTVDSPDDTTKDPVDDVDADDIIVNEPLDPDAL